MPIGENFTSIRLQGELGNQLFQWATGYVVSRKTNAPLLVVSEPNQMRLNEFVLTEDMQFSFLEKEREVLREPTLLNRIVSKFYSKEDSDATSTEFSEKTLHYADKEILTPSSGLSLIGYFQSWKYLRGYEDEIRAKIKLLSPSEEFVRLSSVFASQPFIGMHIRRGAAGKAILNKNFHGLLPTDYYKSALEILGQIKAPLAKKLVIFTDNKDEALKLVMGLSLDSVEIIDPKMNLSPGENLLLMSMCDGFIGANSSFSWWGAFLNPNQSNIFIFPRPWYKEPGIPAQENLYPHWLSIGFSDFLG
jgi:hypothetical protein